MSEVVSSPAARAPSSDGLVLAGAPPAPVPSLDRYQQLCFEHVELLKRLALKRAQFRELVEEIHLLEDQHLDLEMRIDHLRAELEVAARDCCGFSP